MQRPEGPPLTDGEFLELGKAVFEETRKTCAGAPSSSRETLILRVRGGDEEDLGATLVCDTLAGLPLDAALAERIAGCLGLRVVEVAPDE